MTTILKQQQAQLDQEFQPLAGHEVTGAITAVFETNKINAHVYTEFIDQLHNPDFLENLREIDEIIVIIVLTKNSQGPSPNFEGNHWFLLITDQSLREIFLFDTYGRTLSTVYAPFQFDVPNWLEKTISLVPKVEAVVGEACGYYCIRFCEIISTNWFLNGTLVDIIYRACDDFNSLFKTPHYILSESQKPFNNQQSELLCIQNDRKVMQQVSQRLH